MDVLLRLRVLIWILVISLWGVMVYQYLGEDQKESAAMRPVVNPYQPPEPLPPPLAPASDAGTPPGGETTETNAPSASPSLAPGLLAPALTASQMSADPALNVRPSPGTVGPAPSDERRDEPPAAVEAPPARA
ncbi:MAG: hypothetical protein KGL74_07370, partial [Elusimicrobia bacterium]|nr:hypothetical protein [Elusimicrobiota bacterium]